METIRLIKKGEISSLSKIDTGVAFLLNKNE